LLAHGFKDGGRQIQFIEVHTEAPEGAYIPAVPHGMVVCGQSKAGRFKGRDADV
jgi:hypothetical protein